MPNFKNISFQSIHQKRNTNKSTNSESQAAVWDTAEQIPVKAEYSAQDLGNMEHLGFAADERDYQIAQKMLENLGVQKIKLMTNNPAKINTLVSEKIEVTERVPHVFTRSENKNYLATKKNKMGHLL